MRRSTGSELWCDTKHVQAATSHVLTGRLVTAIGELGRDISTMAVIYLLGLVALLFAPETKRRRLPD